MEISRYLRQHARTIAGKSQLFINSYAKALEVDLWSCFFFLLEFVCSVVTDDLAKYFLHGEEYHPSFYEVMECQTLILIFITMMEA